MSPLVKNKNFYFTLISIVLPIAGQNLITFTVGMADTIMLGKLGEVVLSAASLAGQYFFVLMIAGFGIASASTVFASQYWGRGDTESIKKIMAIMLRTVFVLSLLFTLVARFFPELIMSCYSPDPEVIKAGSDYLKILCYGFIPFSVTSTLLIILRSVHTVKISLLVYFSSLVVNVFFNWVLIFGNLGFPEMGIRGAALATVLARICELAIMLIFYAFFEKKIHFHFKDVFAPVGEHLKAFIKTGSPVIANEMIWALGTSVLAAIIGNLDTDFVAANSIANVVWQFVSVFIMGLGNATAVVIGNAVGCGEHPKYIKQKANTVIIIAFVIGLISAGLMLLVRPIAIDFYEVKESTKELAWALLNSYAIIVVFQSLSMQYIVGILRGGGDTRFAMLADTGFLWFVSLPLGYIAGFKLGWAPPLVYLVLKSDEILKVIACTWRVQCTKWVKNVTIKEDDEKTDDLI